MIPYSYNQLNILDSTSTPSGVHVTNTETAAFFRRYLLEKAISRFKWTLPDGWSEEYTMLQLFVAGSFAVFRSNKFGVIPQGGVPFGLNVFYQPYQYTVANPLLPDVKKLVIDKECVVFRCKADFGGIYDLVCFYADMMALAAQAAGVNLINSKLSFAFGVDDDKGNQSIQKALTDIQSGKPAVVVNKKMFNDRGELSVPFFQQNVGQNFIALQLLEVLRTLENMFCTAAGIPNANTTKRERLISDEVNSNNFETLSPAESMLDRWQKSCKKVKEMFGVDMWVELREIGGVDDASSDNDNNRSV